MQRTNPKPRIKKVNIQFRSIKLQNRIQLTGSRCVQIKQEGNQVRRRAAQLERKKEDERPVAVNTIEGPKTVPRNLPVRRTNTTADLY